MSNAFRCANERRKRLLLDLPAGAALNGIDWLEVDPADRTALRVHCLRAVGAGAPLAARVEGAPRSIPVEVTSVTTNDSTTVVVQVGQRGDEGLYRLRLVSPSGGEPPTGFDPQLCEVEFSFQVGCPCEFDCREPVACAAERGDEAPMDYMARDAASLRRMMFDRLSLTVPAWTERNPADLGVALVELFAHLGDRLSYFQDAVATEAYLGTARLRTSVRRHARLLDYDLHEGSNARVWVAFHASAAQTFAAGQRILTRSSEPPGALAAERVPAAVGQGALVFETLHRVRVEPGLNELSFYTWDAEECALPRGATSATLLWSLGADSQALRAGLPLLLEERIGPDSGRPEDADRSRRHVVRLRSVSPSREDPLHPGTWVREIAWDAEDALPFALVVSSRSRETGATLDRVSVARGNLALAEHASALPPFTLTLASVIDERRVLRIPLDVACLTHRAAESFAQGASNTTDALPRSASQMLRQDPRETLPALRLRETEGGAAWEPRRHLLASRGSDRHFVVEVEGGRCFIRFGDDLHGRRPEPGTAFTVELKTGLGRVGNVDPEALANVVLGASDGSVVSVRNPLPARGGVDPEPTEHARGLAPVAFRRQERAVTLDDWVAATLRHPGVQNAVATQRWTGSWHTVFLTVDRLGGADIDEVFREELRARLERYRLAGCDLEIDGPRYVPIEVVFRVCVANGHLRSDVKRALLDLFSSRELPDGSRGIFHPDRMTFGQPIYLSPLIEAAVRVPGVASVKPALFQRMGRAPTSVSDSTPWPARDTIALSRLEIARLDDLRAHPQRGRVDFLMSGGM